MVKISAKRTLLAGSAALVLVGAAMGIAGAQQSPTPTAGATAQAQTAGPQSTFLDALAQRLGITVVKLQQEIAGARQDAGLPPGPPNGGFPFGGHRGNGGRGEGGRGGLDSAAAATAMNITVAQLKQELPGQSLVQVASKHGVSRDALLAALTTAATQRIDTAVTNGRLTAQQATDMKAALAQRLGALVDRQMPAAGVHPPEGADDGPMAPGVTPGAQGTPRTQ